MTVLAAVLASLVGFWGAVAAAAGVLKGLLAPAKAVAAGAVHAVLTHPLAVVALYVAAALAGYYFGNYEVALLAATAAFTSGWFGWDADKLAARS